MRLDLNNTGAWKHLMSFHPDYLEEVQASASTMLGLSEEVCDRTTLRITEDNGSTVVAYASLDLKSGEWEWAAPKRRVAIDNDAQEEA